MIGNTSHMLARLIPIYFVSAVLFTGCNQTPTAPAKVAAEPIAQREEMVLKNPETSLEIFGASMSRSNARKVSGDMRPLWIVQGRVHNKTPNTLKSITLYIEMTAKNGDPADSTTLTIDSPVEPFATIAFSREVQLLPPGTDWTWTIQATKGIANTE